MQKKGLIMYEMVYLWLAIAFSCIIGELHTPGLFFLLSGAGGAAGATVLALLNYSLAGQIFGFCVAAAVWFRILHRFVQRAEKKVGMRTNADALVGVRGTVVRSCTTMERGLVKVRGEIWSAYAADRHIVHKKDDIVEIVAVRGCHLTVKELTSGSQDNNNKDKG